MCAFPAQDLSPEDLERLALALGRASGAPADSDLHIHPTAALGEDGRPKVGTISNKADSRGARINFKDERSELASQGIHTDISCAVDPLSPLSPPRAERLTLSSLARPSAGSSVAPRATRCCGCTLSPQRAATRSSTRRTRTTTSSLRRCAPCSLACGRATRAPCSASRRAGMGSTCTWVRAARRTTSTTRSRLRVRPSFFLFPLAFAPPASTRWTVQCAWTDVPALAIAGGEHSVLTRGISLCRPRHPHERRHGVQHALRQPVLHRAHRGRHVRREPRAPRLPLQAPGAVARRPGALQVVRGRPVHLGQLGVPALRHVRLRRGEVRRQNRLCRRGARVRCRAGQEPQGGPRVGCLSRLLPPLRYESLTSSSSIPAPHAPGRALSHPFLSLIPFPLLLFLPPPFFSLDLHSLPCPCCSLPLRKR